MRFIIALLVLLSISCSEPAQSAVSTGEFSLKDEFNYKFDQPVFMAQWPVKYDKLATVYAVLEKKGRIVLALKGSSVASERVSILIDMRRRVRSQGWEEGLLGLAFDPEFQSNKRLYLYYSASSPRRTVLSRITLKPSKTAVKPYALSDLSFDYELEPILSIRQPYANHNGGMIAFGPDNLLYIGVGDGGSGGDPRGYGQNRKSLLGTILRLDVSTEKDYRIPRSNPYAQSDKYRREIFAYGLRNPWRFSFDRKSGRLIAGDVGQNKYEEVSVIENGGNYGWNIMEAFHCFKPQKNCSRKGLEMPVLEYSHSRGQSIVGGYVYHGKKLPDLRGRYIFADTMTGRIWAAETSGSRWSYKRIADTGYFFSSLAEDSDGELYFLEMNKGLVLSAVYD